MPRAEFARRSFLRGLMGAGLASTGSMGRVLAAPGAAGANDRITVGVIGVGGRGSSLLGAMLKRSDVRVAAVCDVDEQRRAAAKEKVGSKATAYGDYRQVLDRADIDAVLIATPDHWHALTTIHACQAGKDVYCEKPLSHSLVEGRRMVEAARKHKRVVQTGTQHRTERDIREVCELIRSGRIGRVNHVELWMWENPYYVKSPGVEPPAHLDWDRWLGPAPKVAYHPKRCHFNFRWFRDYAGGYMTDWGAHMLNVVTWAMDVDLAGPVSVEGTETAYENSLYEFPQTQRVTWHYRNPDFKLTWAEPGAKRSRDRYGMQFHGSDGTLFALFGKYQVFRDGKEVTVEPPGSKSGDVELPRTPGNDANWLECIRTRNRPINDVEIGHRNASLCHLGNIASQLGRSLRWDAERERFEGDTQANAMRFRPYRSPWKLV